MLSKRKKKIIKSQRKVEEKCAEKEGMIDQESKNEKKLI